MFAQTAQATIPSGQSASSPIHLGGCEVGFITFPAALDGGAGAKIRLQVSADGVTFNDAQAESTAIEATFTANQAWIPTARIRGTYIRLVSLTSAGAAQNQSAARTFNVVSVA